MNHDPEFFRNLITNYEPTSVYETAKNVARQLLPKTLADHTEFLKGTLESQGSNPDQDLLDQHKAFSEEVERRESAG